MKIDISKFEKPQKEAKNKQKDGSESTQIGSIQVCKGMGYHKTRRIVSEIALNQVLPWHFEKGDVWHCISMGDVDSLTYLRVIVKQQKINYLVLSTWCMSITDIEEIASWIDEGYIKRVDFYVGEIFTSRYASEFVVLKGLCKRTGGRVALFRNHSKVMAGFGEEFDFVIESSANVNTNPRTEQATITIDSEVPYFYKEFYDGIKSVDDTFKDWKPQEVQKKWQANKENQSS